MANLVAVLAEWTDKQTEHYLTVDVGLPKGTQLYEVLAGMLAASPSHRITMAAAAAHAGWKKPISGTRTQKHQKSSALDERVVLNRGNRLALLREALDAVAREAKTRGVPGAANASAKVPADLIKRLQAAFRANAGSLNRDQFKKALQDSGVTSLLPPSLNLDSLFNLLDEDGSGGVDKRELLAGLAYLLAPAATDEIRLSLTFHAYDTNGDGVLSPEELRVMLNAYGVPAMNTTVAGQGATGLEGKVGEGIEAWLARRRETMAELDSLVKLLDTDGSGDISLPEFLAGLGKRPQLAMSLLRRVPRGEDNNDGDNDDDDNSSGAGANPALRRRF
jgi:Ca2+-binding EF-hand superfamily protein